MDIKLHGAQASKSRVYILLDDKRRVVRLEGEYSLPNDLTNWIKIDEGNGDRYALAQSHYLAKPLYTQDGIPQYKLDDGIVTPRTEDEIEADRAKLPQPEIQPTNKELMDAILELSKTMEA